MAGAPVKFLLLSSKNLGDLGLVNGVDLRAGIGVGYASLALSDHQRALIWQYPTNTRFSSAASKISKSPFYINTSGVLILVNQNDPLSKETLIEHLAFIDDKIAPCTRVIPYTLPGETAQAFAKTDRITVTVLEPIADFTLEKLIPVLEDILQPKPTAVAEAAASTPVAVPLAAPGTSLASLLLSPFQNLFPWLGVTPPVPMTVTQEGSPLHTDPSGDVPGHCSIEMSSFGANTLAPSSRNSNPHMAIVSTARNSSSLSSSSMSSSNSLDSLDSSSVSSLQGCPRTPTTFSNVGRDDIPTLTFHQQAKQAEERHRAASKTNPDSEIEMFELLGSRKS